MNRSSEGSDGVAERVPEEGATEATGRDSVAESSRGRVEDDEAEEDEGPGEDLEESDFLLDIRE